MSNIDPLTFAHFLYDHGRAPKILAKASLWKVPLLGGILTRTGMIPVQRNTAGAASSVGAAVDQLTLGECVAVFPEGTLTRDPDLWPMVGKTGAARLALASRKPVVPIAQWGCRTSCPATARGSGPSRPRTSRCTPPPVDLSDLYERPVDTATLREATNRIMDAITALLEEIRGEKAPAERFDVRKNPGSEERK
ncbi:lysophospholipid acyltransferase family protein [Oerskovia sp. M15]